MGGFKKGIWIARDEDGRLYMYSSRPKKCKDPWSNLGEFRCGASTDLIALPSTWYKNLNFKNSPVFVPIPEQLVEQQIKQYYGNILKSS